MSYEFNEDFQYNSCISRGICSINPKNSALQTVIVLYLRLFSKFAKNFIENNKITSEIKDFILRVISSTVYNFDFNDKTFYDAIEGFKKYLPKIIDSYFSEIPNSEEHFNIEKENALKLFENTTDIVGAIKYGEKKFQEGQKILTETIRDLYNIMLVISKSLSINILELESFEKKYNDGFNIIIELLSLINIEEENIETIKNMITKATKINNEIMNLIKIAQEERYGEQGVGEVSYTTIPNKAILVVGSNIRELEIILEKLKNENIDVYTHDEMMLAHTFPKFQKYSKLKGQFGQGVENCLLDFATFPGPIILTKNSLHNIDNLYRGRLFTTDTTVPKGVIQINNQNFSEVIESAKTSKGFKHGRQCESVSIGYNKEIVEKNIKNSLENKNYKNIFIIGLEGYSLEQKSYFEKLIKLSPDDILIISFSYDYPKKNLIHINACFDNYAIIKIFNLIKNYDKKITVFIPKCDRNSVSEMIYMTSFKNTNLYVGNCIPILLNPSLMQTLEKNFKIKNITSVKKDLEEIIHSQ